MSYERALKTAIDAAMEAGEYLRREFHRWGGPRGHGSHADADEEAEVLIRKRLLANFPSYGYRGEETGTVTSTDLHVWLVDPNDGTSSYLRGVRGSAVSIGLVRRGIPVAGVVYAFVAPDDRGDLFYWAEGFELTRNNVPVRHPWKTKKKLPVLVSPHRDSMADIVLDVLQPYRYQALPSIAYRLALVAAGEGCAAVSWHNPGDWDYAAGHALIRGAGGTFQNEQGEEVTYGTDGRSEVQFCFGGEPSVVRDLRYREWHRIYSVFRIKPTIASRAFFSFPRPLPGKAIFSASLLSRAQGCLMGHLSADAIEPGREEPMEDSRWNTIAGQPHGDSERMLMLARSILMENRYHASRVAEAYHYWLHETRPFDTGTGNPLRRMTPLALHGYRKSVGCLWKLARQETALTRRDLLAAQASGLFLCTLAFAVESGQSPDQIYSHAVAVARKMEVMEPVRAALAAAELYRPKIKKESSSAVTELQNAFYQLLHAPSFRDGVIDTIKYMDSAAVAGALLGAVHGRDAVPLSWQKAVLTCRPHPAARALHPRPPFLWPIDLMILAERLLLTG